MIKLNHLDSNYTLVEREVPANKEALAEIRNILEGIKERRLLHNQNAFHSVTECGTAHCIAGWKVHLDALQAGLNPVYKGPIDDEAYCPEIDSFVTYHVGRGIDWEYAEVKWELTASEARALFSDSATLKQQFELLEVLEAGLSIKMKCWLLRLFKL